MESSWSSRYNHTGNSYWNSPDLHRILSILLLVALSVVLNTTTIARSATTGDAVNVKSMGARDDGVTDDLEAFKAAIAKADPEKGGSGLISVPPSDKPYLLSAPISLHTNQVLLSEPRTAVIAPVLPYPTPNKSPLLLSVKDASHVIIRGLVFDGRADKSESSSPIISVLQSDHVSFDYVEVKNSRGIGILFSGTGGGVKYSGIQRCKFENIGKYYLQSGHQKEDRHAGLPQRKIISKEHKMVEIFIAVIAIM
jgi:hypothetical protein